MVNTDNHYLKKILGKVTGTVVRGNKNNNQLLKEISENIGTGGGDGGSSDMSDYYNKNEINSLLGQKADIESDNYATTSKNIFGVIGELMGRKAENNHSHGAIDANGKITMTLSTPSHVIVAERNNSIAKINKLPSSLVEHQDITGKMDKVDYETKELIITYSDDTTETVNFMVEK